MICGLDISIWKKSFNLYINKNKVSKILNKYFLFLIHFLASFNISTFKKLKNLLSSIKKFLIIR